MFKQTFASLLSCLTELDQVLLLLLSGHDRASGFRGAAPIGRKFLWGLRPPQKLCICILRRFPACSAYVDGGWFKTRNGLTERAETILLKLQCYWLSLYCVVILTLKFSTL